MKSLLDATAMNHCKSMATPGSKGQESSRNVTDLIEKLDPQEHREFRSVAGIRQYLTERRFDIAFSTKEFHEGGSRTDHTFNDKIEENRALPQRTPAMCTEFPLGWEAGRRHPCDRGCRLGWRPKDKVLHVHRSTGGPCFTVRHWSVTHATVLLSSAETQAKAKTKGCIEALYEKNLLEHQTARPFEIEVWTDSSSAKAIIERLGPGRRAKHLEVQTMWVQQLNKIGLVSLNKLNTLENVAELLTKHVPRAVLDKLSEMMGYTFPDEETQEFQEYTNINQNYWDQKLEAVERLPVFDDGENESLDDDVHSFVDKTSHLSTAVMRRGFKMNILYQPYVHRPHRDPVEF